MREYLRLEECSASEQRALVSDTWCDTCEMADLGITEPVLYLEGGRKFIAGKCTRCGAICTTEIISKQVSGI